MGGTRYTHKLKGRLNLGKSKLTLTKTPRKKDVHIYCDEKHIGADELADMFFCNIEKIKKAARMGILKDANISSKKWFFNREDAIETLSSYIGKDGQLDLFNHDYKKRTVHITRKPRNMTKKLTLLEIENDPSSSIKLICTSSYSGAYNVSVGGIMRYNYQKGQVLPRSKIMLVSGKWDIYKKPTLEEVEKDTTSVVELICTKTHKGSFNMGAPCGGVINYSYKKGEVLPRNKIYLDSGYWKIYNPEKKIVKF